MNCQSENCKIQRHFIITFILHCECGFVRFDICFILFKILANQIEINSRFKINFLGPFTVPCTYSLLSIRQQKTPICQKNKSCVKGPAKIHEIRLETVYCIITSEIKNKKIMRGPYILVLRVGHRILFYICFILIKILANQIEINSRF